jgi:hypothetical protein
MGAIADFHKAEGALVQSYEYKYNHKGALSGTGLTVTVLFRNKLNTLTRSRGRLVDIDD